MRALSLSPSLLLLVCSAVFHAAAGQGIEWLNGGERMCRVSDLIPVKDEVAEQWSSSMVETPLFDCSCPYLKSSYYCPHYEFKGYPIWEPKAVKEGRCRVVSLEQLRESPFPPNSRILFHGNSHLRQPLEGIMCMFKDTLKSRLVKYTDLITGEETEAVVDPDVHCRGCLNKINYVRKLLERDNCVVGNSKDACRCDDNVGEFEFLNGAQVQFYFAHKSENKTISDALHVRDTKFEDYDIIIGNAGNPPSVRMTALMESVREIRAAGVPLIWLSTYDGAGDVKKLTDDERAEFFELGAKFIPVHEMVEGFVNFTRGVVEHEANSHYCMPGPPNELALLFLRIIWAHWAETHSSNRV